MAFPRAGSNGRRCATFVSSMKLKMSRRAGCPDGGAQFGRETDLIDEVSGVRLADPESQCFAHTVACLLDRPAVAVGTGNTRDMRNPRSALVPLVNDLVIAQQLLTGHA